MPANHNPPDTDHVQLVAQQQDGELQGARQAVLVTGHRGDVERQLLPHGRHADARLVRQVHHHWGQAFD